MNKEERKFLKIMESQGYTYDENQEGEGIKVIFDDGKEYVVTVHEINILKNTDKFHLEKVISELKLIHNGMYRLIPDNKNKIWHILYEKELDEIIQQDDDVAFDIANIFVKELNKNNIYNYSLNPEEKERFNWTDKEWLNHLNL